MATITVGTGKDYASIHTALANARVGTDSDFDIIEVYDGTYVESVTSSVVEFIHITAAPGNFPVLDGESTETSAFSMVGTDGEWTICGFEIKNYDVPDANAAIQGSFPNGSHININNCAIHDCNRGIQRIVGRTTTATASIERNQLFDITEYGMLGVNANFTIMNNLIRNIETYTGIRGTAVDNCRIINNTIANTHSHGIQLSYNGADISVRNNIVYATASTGYALNLNQLHAGYVIRSHNLITGTFDQGYFSNGDAVNELSGTDAGFVNAAAHDYNLTAEITGSALTIAFTDIIGRIRGIPRTRTGSLEFNGASDYIDVDSVVSLLTGSDFSMAAWIKSDGGTNDVIFGINDDSGTANVGINLGIFATPGNGELAVYDNGYSVTGSTPINDRYWHLVGFTSDESTREVKIYVDGVEDGTGTATGFNGMTSSYKISLGQKFDPGLVPSEFYGGSMSDASIWNKVLTAGEMSELYNGGVAGQLGAHSAMLNLMGWYPLDDFIGASAVRNSADPSDVFTGSCVGLINTDVITCDNVINVDVGAFEYIAPYWTDYMAPPNQLVSEDYIIQQNGKEEYKRRAGSQTVAEVDQVPVVLFSRGVWKYRARKEAYLATRGRKQDPNDITGS